MVLLLIFGFVFQLRFQIFWFFRVEKAKAHRAVFCCRMVVHAVGEDKAVEIAPFGRIVKWPALMDEAIMDKAVKQAVKGKAERDKPKRCPP